METKTQFVHHISTTMVKPSLSQPLQKQHINLAPWDLRHLSVPYMEYGILFSGLPPADQLLSNLKTSLSAVLCHFYPLAGRLITDKGRDSEMFVSLECGGAELGGVEFKHAVAKKVSVVDVTSDDVVPYLIQSFFPLDNDTAVGHDGHFMPLAAVQLTELVDGIFLGLSLNHVVGDGTSLWNFFSSWAEICRNTIIGKCTTSMHLDQIMHDRWFVEGVIPPIKLPFSHSEEFIRRLSPVTELNIKSRFFHFSSRAMSVLKSEANGEGETDCTVSSFQALCSLMWRSAARARNLPRDQMTVMFVAANDRPRLHPPLSEAYFGNAANKVVAVAEVGELLASGIGWGARRVYESLAAHNDKAVRDEQKAWVEKPVILRPGSSSNGLWFGMVGSPRMNVEGCDFGWGKPVGVRSGRMCWTDGIIASFPGMEGRGSVDLQVTLSPDAMDALLKDDELLRACLVQKEGVM